MNMNKLFQIGNKLRLDKGEDNAFQIFPPYVEILYMNAKTCKDINTDIYKRMAGVCVNNYSVVDEKKAKKNSFEQLSSTFIESDKKCGDDILTRETILHSNKAIEELSKITKDFDKKLSAGTIRYFQESAEDGSLSTLKKALVGINKDIKVREEKLHSLQEQVHSQSYENHRRSAMDPSSAMMNSSGGSSGGSGAAGGGLGYAGRDGGGSDKLTAALQAEENSEKELEAKKDQFLTRLFVTEAQKVQMAEKMLEFFEEYLEFFSGCQAILTKNIPELKQTIERGRQQFVFNLPLVDHIRTSDKKLSCVLETCIQELDTEEVLKQEGLFRVSGSKNKIDLLKNALNVNRVDDSIMRGCDSSVFASVLKQYLRELPEPLMSTELYAKWCEVGSKYRQNAMEEATAIAKNCLLQLDPAHYDNLAYLMQFLRKVADNSADNKMTTSNLSLMFGPNLIRLPYKEDGGSISLDDDSVSKNMLIGACGASAFDFLIINYHELFPNAPVYPTKPAPKRSPEKTVPGLLFGNGELELTPAAGTGASFRSPRSNSNVGGSGDTDSISSGDMLEEAASRSQDPVTANSQRIKFLRKAPAPPPPPTNAATSRLSAVPPEIITPSSPQPSVDSIEFSSGGELPATSILMRPNPPDLVPEMRQLQAPQIKKRFSRLEKPALEVAGDDLSPGNGVSRNVSAYGSRSQPSLPVKKPVKSLASPTTPDAPSAAAGTKGTKAEIPRRPANPPPPIPNPASGRDRSATSGGTAAGEEEVKATGGRAGERSSTVL